MWANTNSTRRTLVQVSLSPGAVSGLAWTVHGHGRRTSVPEARWRGAHEAPDAALRPGLARPGAGRVRVPGLRLRAAPAHRRPARRPGDRGPRPPGGRLMRTAPVRPVATSILLLLLLEVAGSRTP